MTSATFLAFLTQLDPPPCVLNWCDENQQNWEIFWSPLLSMDVKCVCPLSQFSVGLHRIWLWLSQDLRRPLMFCFSFTLLHQPIAQYHSLQRTALQTVLLCCGLGWCSNVNEKQNIKGILCSAYKRAWHFGLVFCTHTQAAAAAIATTDWAEFGKGEKGEREWDAHATRNS